MQNPNEIEVIVDVSKHKLTKAQEALLFRDLGLNSTAVIAMKYGFDKKYKDMNQARAAVYALYKKVLSKPDSYGITVAEAEAIRDAIAQRKLGSDNQKVLLDQREKQHYIKEALGGIRDTTAKIIEMKLAKALNSSKERDKISFKDLSTILSMSVDKGRLLGGESTENVLHYARIDKDVSPQDALKIVLKAREALIENKNS